MSEEQYQQTFVLMKTSWRRLEGLFCLCLQKMSSRRLQDALIKIDMFVLAIRLQDVFKTSSRHFQDAFKTSCKSVFKTSSRRLAKTSSRRLPLRDIFETSLRRFEDVLKTSSRHLAKMSSGHFQDVSSG